MVEPVPLDVRYDSNDEQPTYIGLNFLSYDADTSENTWTIYKYTYSGVNATRIQRRDNISWDNRGSLF